MRRAAAGVVAAVLAATMSTSSAIASDVPVVLAGGHVDIGPRIADGSWRVGLRDGTVDPPVWREGTDTVLAVPDSAELAVPDDPRFAFLGAPGERVWALPQVQQADLVWPGWNTGDPSLAGAVSGDITWRLTAVDGPGRVAVFLTGDFGDPSVVFDSARPLPQDIPLAGGTHAHGTWAFAAPGAYRLHIEMSAPGISGDILSDRADLQFYVGPGDPRAAFPAPAAQPTPVPEVSSLDALIPEALPSEVGSPNSAGAGGKDGMSLNVALSGALAGTGVVAALLLARRRPSRKAAAR